MLLLVLGLLVVSESVNVGCDGKCDAGLFYFLFFFKGGGHYFACKSCREQGRCVTFEFLIVYWWRGTYAARKKNQSGLCSAMLSCDVAPLWCCFLLPSPNHFTVW